MKLDISAIVSNPNLSQMISPVISNTSRTNRATVVWRSLNRSVAYRPLIRCASAVSFGDDEPRIISEIPVISYRSFLTLARVSTSDANVAIIGWIGTKDIAPSIPPLVAKAA